MLEVGQLEEQEPSSSQGLPSSAVWGPLAPGGPGFVASLGCDAGKACCALVPEFFLLCNGNCSEYSCAGAGLRWLVRADH